MDFIIFLEIYLNIKRTCEKYMTQTLQNESALLNAVEGDAKIIKICQTCKKSQDQLLRCSKCKKVYYCNIECQKADWVQHKLSCNKQRAQIPDGVKQKIKEKRQNEDGLNQFGKLTHVGTGNFSVIYKTASKKDGKIYAVKQVQKAKVQRMRKQADIYMQKHCLNKLKECPYVVKLYKTFQDQISLYFQMEFPENGELWEASKTFGVASESVFKYYASHIVKAVSILHNQYQIVHRDLKPENILLDSQNNIKLIDFGTAKDLDRPDIKGAGNGLKGKKQFEHYVGTAHYMAPQCIHNKASEKKSDIYSLSGVFYFLKVGSPPFQGGSEYLTFTKTLQTQILACPELFNEELRDLMKKMNCKQMKDRIDINQVMSHPYFKQVDFENLGSYNQSLQKITKSEKYLIDLCQKLKKILESEKEPKIQRRIQIYQKEVKPLLEKQKDTLQQSQNPEKSNLKQKLFIIDIQCQCFLNIRDNNNISFTELYKQAKGIAYKKAEEIIEQKQKKQIHPNEDGK